MMEIETMESTNKYLAALLAQPTLIERIRKAQKENGEFNKLKGQVTRLNFQLQTDGTYGSEVDCG